MIKINRDFETLAKNHFNGLEPLLEKRISEIKNKDLKDFLNENIEQIIITQPEQLLNLENKCYEIVGADAFIELKSGKRKKYSYIFDYDFFVNEPTQKFYKTKYWTYTLAQALNINVCPYCNRNFTNTVKEEDGTKVIRPDFDHFFSQKEHPILALSFYNLIPSCQICNSRLKGKTKFNLKDYFHPYLNGFENEISFNYQPSNVKGVYGVQNNFEISFEEATGIQNSKLKKANEVFKYDKIYKYHSDIIEEIIAKLYKGSESYFESLKSAFPELKLTEDEIYRLAFGNYMNEEDFEKRPFAKLTKDIFEKHKRIV